MLFYCGCQRDLTFMTFDIGLVTGFKMMTTFTLFSGQVVTQEQEIMEHESIMGGKNHFIYL